ncbi:AAA family ATPase [Ferrimonas lipolytica]|uniref:AAA domain-containing protein n=1 Tax=Ferrimonas lipolytica TaxID=2724191 RepID=A0A6H1UBV1_9GAMM|nr:AAA family ATPase [Ferrimonas lipolytica]QIZ76060.1 AAA domain-containing protein [Ferrimonas lipolytica]
MDPRVSPVLKQLGQVLLDKPVELKLAITCLLAGGHLLLEDLPGMGKTTLSTALAKSLGLSHQRLQFTADMLPADLLGVNIFDPALQKFEFHSGPIFSQVLLADEINRASPKTQSALLEAMAEQQVSVDGTTYPLPQPFFVIATQNPQEQSGTFPLPESQLDRFMMRLSLGYPGLAAEKKLLKGEHLADNLNQLLVQLQPSHLAEMQLEGRQVEATEAVLDYLLALINHSRNSDNGSAPLSPRASRALLAAAKAWALISGRHYVVPDDIQAVFAAVTEHRLRAGLRADGTLYAQQILLAVNPIQ